MPATVHIFCRIIDNFGDIGVCWRLARQLATEHALAVTLWVDDLAVFARLAPSLDSSAATQTLTPITVCQWDDAVIANTLPAKLVIEGFGCPLPTAYLQRMAAMQPAPCWINLEYLSAESWVEGCHGLSSPHPSTGLAQHFYFPGFTPKTGGLLREADLTQMREHFQSDVAQQHIFWTSLGLPNALNYDSRYSLFAYENPAIADWLSALAQQSGQHLVVIPENRALTSVQRTVNHALHAGSRLRYGNVDIAVIPLLAHESYDRLLWACDLNMVRGEDSFVRAQWAARPFLWHIYPQDENTHLIKLDAFIQQHQSVCSSPSLWAEAMQQWNLPSPKMDWPAFFQNLPSLQRSTRIWSDYLAQQPDLATELMHFWLRQVE